MRQSLDAYREPFKAVVLQHIRKSMPAAEWARLRALASDRRRCVDRSFKIDPDASPAALLDAALCEDSISVDETLVAAFKARAVEVGQVEGQPVRYVSGEGIYLWGLDPARGFTLSFWATYPAYPPSW
jgi:hypothetical protein